MQIQQKQNELPKKHLFVQEEWIALLGSIMHFLIPLPPMAFKIQYFTTPIIGPPLARSHFFLKQAMIFKVAASFRVQLNKLFRHQNIQSAKVSPGPYAP